MKILLGVVSGALAGIIVGSVGLTVMMLSVPEALNLLITAANNFNEKKEERA